MNLAIEKDSANYFAWAERSRYFVNLNDYTQAHRDINTADSLNPGNGYVLQIRGMVLEKMGDYRNALLDYNKVLTINPGDLESRMNRMIIYLIIGQYNLCQKDAEFILQIQPDDLTAIYCLAMCSLHAEDYEESIRLIQLGIEKAPKFAGFYSLMGQVLTRQGSYTEAGMFLNRALELKPEDIGSYYYKAEATIRHQTNPAVLKKNQYPPAFLSIKSSELDRLDKLAKSKKHTYYYNNLKKKFLQDWRSLSLDEFFMLYYGYSAAERYAPYARGERTVIDSMLSTMNRGLYIEAAAIGKDYLEDHPSEISIYYYTGLAFLKSSMYAEAEEFFHKYHGFISSLIAAGDGETPESAFIVISTDDEYTLMDYLGYSFLEQKLTEYHDQFFDILTIMTTSGEKKEIYFNISKPFRTLKKFLK